MSEPASGQRVAPREQRVELRGQVFIPGETAGGDQREAPEDLADVRRVESKTRPRENLRVLCQDPLVEQQPEFACKEKPEHLGRCAFSRQKCGHQHVGVEKQSSPAAPSSPHGFDLRANLLRG